MAQPPAMVIASRVPAAELLLSFRNCSVGDAAVEVAATHSQNGAAWGEFCPKTRMASKGRFAVDVGRCNGRGTDEVGMLLEALVFVLQWCN